MNGAQILEAFPFDTWASCKPGKFLPRPSSNPATCVHAECVDWR
jgi:hypothetical protein